MKAKLTYFKESGKYYTEGEYETKATVFHEAISEIASMLNRGEAPGLSKMDPSFDTLVQLEHSPPFLVKL